MPIPEERTGVPPGKVENIIKIMMQNTKVKKVECVRNPDGTYDLKPIPK